MSLSNYERVGKSLELLKSGLSWYVEQEMKAVYGDSWQDTISKQQPADARQKQDKKEYWDVQKLLSIMWNNWEPVFGKTLGHSERSLVSEIREIRVRWAHQDAFSSNDAHRALDSIARLLNAILATEEHAEVEKMRIDLLRVQFDEQRRTELRKTSFQATEGKPQQGLKPWREVVTPHPDVASGRYQKAEFAADLWQVYMKEASPEYQDPIEFFKRTYITEGLKQLLKNSLERLSGKGGDPVVELQTNFGGGKTHSMLALYHLFSGTPAAELTGVESLIKEVDTQIPPTVRRVVLVGTKISPGQPRKKDDGTIVRTLWGEIAWQLGGKEGYEMVREDDERATNPGDTIKEVFNKYSPCLILIDEWVAYARQLHEGSNLPAGSFDTQFTFAQTLSESAKTAKNTLLVVSIPASDNEIGGEWGKQALSRLKNAIGRVESPWRPASSDEGFEIVRRRLFQPLTNEQAVIRDAVARSYVLWYGAHHQEFPSECKESSYERRIKQAYPIHPELFDRLYNDWSTLDKFQRTRGVLRLMAAVIHSLWENGDSNLLIMPATMPLDDPVVQREITRYLEDQWIPIMERDIDGPNSLPRILDRDNPSLGRYSACRRVARTVYMGSAPTLRLSHRGIDDRLVKLGCVQPGESVATFGDALRRLTDKATYLYVDGTRYWYSTHPTVTRLAEDRAIQKSQDDVHEEIRKRLRARARQRGEFSKVHACVSSGDVPDERETRLVILDPSMPHTLKNTTSPARNEYEDILSMRGSSPRTYRNTLVFLAADSTRVKELEDATRQYLAWKSIFDEKEELNLDTFQRKQAETKCGSSDDTVNVRIPEVYQWLLVPVQSDPKGVVEWQEIRLQGQDDLAVRACRKLKTDGIFMIQMAGGPLRYELDRIPLWRGNQVMVKQLMDDFATYLYLPKIKDEDVIIAAVRSGLNMINAQDGIAYAQKWDESAQRHIGLHLGIGGSVSVDSNGIVVKYDVALEQIEREKVPPPVPPGPIPDPAPGPTPGPIPHNGPQPGPVPPIPEVYHRFYGSVTLDPVRLKRDAEKIADEIIQLLSKQVNPEIEVTMHIRVHLPKGADEKLQRDVMENCKTLKFDSYGFEKE